MKNRGYRVTLSFNDAIRGRDFTCGDAVRNGVVFNPAIKETKKP